MLGSVIPVRGIWLVSSLNPTINNTMNLLSSAGYYRADNTKGLDPHGEYQGFNHGRFLRYQEKGKEKHYKALESNDLHQDLSIPHILH